MNDRSARAPKFSPNNSGTKCPVCSEDAKKRPRGKDGLRPFARFHDPGDGKASGSTPRRDVTGCFWSSLEEEEAGVCFCWTVVCLSQTISTDPIFKTRRILPPPPVCRRRPPAAAAARLTIVARTFPSSQAPVPSSHASLPCLLVPSLLFSSSPHQFLRSAAKGSPGGRSRAQRAA